MGRKIKAAVLILLCVSLFISSSGCSKLGTELYDLLIIQGIGIDKDENGYTITVEAINNAQNTFINGQTNSESVSKKYVIKGESVSQALEDIVKISGKAPMYAHNRVVILGEEAAKSELVAIFDFFIRDNNIRPTIYAAVAKGMTAQKLMSMDLGSDLLLSQYVENILIESSVAGNAFETRIIDVVNYMLDETECICLPALTINENDDKRPIEISGTAVFSKDNVLIGYMGSDETLGALFLNDMVELCNIRVEIGENDSAVLNAERVSTKTKIKYENGRVIVDAHIKASCSLIELTGKSFNDLDEEKVEEIGSITEQKIIGLCKEALKAAQIEYKTDIFRYGRRFWIFDKNDFNSINDDWQNKFSEAEVNVSVEVIMCRTGEEALF